MTYKRIATILFLYGEIGRALNIHMYSFKPDSLPSLSKCHFCCRHFDNIPCPFFNVSVYSRIFFKTVKPFPVTQLKKK